MLTSRELEIPGIRGIDPEQISRKLEKKSKENVPLQARIDCLEVDRQLQ